MLPTRLSSRAVLNSSFNRGVIAETGVIPTGFQLIQDTFAFDIIDKKEVVSEGRNGKEVPSTRVTGLIQMGDRENANGRFYSTRDVLRPAVMSIQDDISARAVMGEYDHPCLTSDDFSVFTCDGWKEFKDIIVGDFVWSRINGEMVKSCVNAITNESYDGIAYRVQGKNINSSFTPGHKFLLERRPDRYQNTQMYATIEDIYKNRQKYLHDRVPCTATLQQKPTDIITIPKIKQSALYKNAKHYKGDILEDHVVDARVFSAFLGIYLAEGGVHGTTVYIDQKNTTGRKLIAELLDQLGFPYISSGRGFRIVDKRLADMLKPFGGLYNKHICQWVKNLSADCLEALVYWFAIGDGRMLVGKQDGQFLSCKSTIAENGGVATIPSLDLGKYSRLAIFTVSKQLIQDLHECAIKTGYCGHLSEITTKNDYIFAGRTIKAQNKQTLHQLHISRNKGFNIDRRFTSIDQFRHTGRIYCLSVDHGNFYIQHNDHSFWTGNSDAKIHLDRVSHLMTKVWMDGRKVFGEAEILHNLPCGACLRGLFEHKVRVGISSRGVGDMEVVENAGKELYHVQPGYAFVTWDAVAEPSVSGAILQIQEGLTKRLRPIKKERHRFSPDAYNNILVAEINKFFSLK